jgi:hypothetical protein
MKPEAIDIDGAYHSPGNFVSLAALDEAHKAIFDRLLKKAASKEDFNDGDMEDLGKLEKIDPDCPVLVRHRRLIGPVIRDNKYVRDGTPFQAAEVAQRIHFHWSRVSALGRQRFQGKGMADVLKGCYQAAVFGRHAYCEGSPGTGKTAGMTWLSKVMDFTIAEFSCSADATDLALVGGEIPAEGLRFVYRSGPVTRVGAIGCLFDELPRLPTQTSNVILDVLAERKKRLSLVASKRADHVMLLSPHWFMMGAGNPAAVGGQSAERSQALWERIQIGLLMPQPQSEERLEMYREHLKGHVDNPMAPQRSDRDVQRRDIRPDGPEGFTFREAQAALYAVTFSDELFKRVIAACYAVTPDQFRRHYGWEGCGFVGADNVERDYLSEYRKKAGKREQTALSDLENMVREYLDPMEGSNPRCELALIDNTRAICLLDWDDEVRPEDRFKVKEDHVAEAFKQAHRARMKALPGDEDKVEGVLQKAVEAFFPQREIAGGGRRK